MDERIFRARARENLRSNWALSIAVAVVACLLGGLLTGSTFLPELETMIPLEHFPALQMFSDWWNRGLHIGTVTLNFRNGIFGFAAFLLGGVLQIGYADFLLKQHDGKEINFRDLFAKFDHFGTGFAQQFLRELYVILWTLLFIIPGIIKGYAYAMTPFILAEHPNLTASQAIDLSKDLMDGHKGELFALDLSFLGWAILAALTLNLGHIVLNPYRNAAYAAFYRQLQAEKRYAAYE